MAIKINPFRPNSPVNPGMFVGRVEEIERLESFLIQTKSDQPMHFMITGERGIGKTSLLMYIRHLAKGDIPLGDETLNYLVVEVDINPSTTQLGMMKRIELGISRELGTSEPGRIFLKEVWSFLKRVKIADSGISEKKRIYFYRSTLGRIRIFISSDCK